MRLVEHLPLVLARDAARSARACRGSRARWRIPSRAAASSSALRCSMGRSLATASLWTVRSRSVTKGVSLRETPLDMSARAGLSSPIVYRLAHRCAASFSPSCSRRLAVLALAATALAATPEEDLAARYAPVVRLVDQPEECGPGEPYLPTDVDVLFGEPTVALRGPWNRTDLVKIGPDGDRPRQPLRVPPRLPRRPAQRRLRLRALGPAPDRRGRSRPSTPTSPPTPATPASSRSSTGSSTRSTTSTTRTRATGR